MSIRDYLSEPFYELAVMKRADAPGDAVPFVGSPRKHPYDEGKILLIDDPLGRTSSILEFRLADVVHAEDLASPVTREGESFPMLRIWVRRGAVGIRYEPFEVAEPVRVIHSFLQGGVQASSTGKSSRP